jgi:UDP:flavonoid glycosyltransferase YjiC (YdhE family)
MLDRLFASAPRHRYDVAYIGDFRRGDEAIALVADEIAAHARAGYSTLLVQCNSAAQPGNPPIRPAVRACVARGEAEVCRASSAEVSARLGILHDPIALAPTGEERLQLRFERAVFAVNWPVFDAAGTPRFNVAARAEELRAWLGCAVEWAPAWPRVRRQLEKLRNGPRLLELDWSPVIDASRWPAEPRAPRGRVPAVGRHSRPEDRFWPERFGDLLRSYPLSDAMDVKLLGVPGKLLRGFSGHMPSNWTLFEYDSVAPERFLSAIDFFLFSHHSRWPHALDRGILEALASGIVTVLPPGLASSFGEAGVYARAGWDSLNRITALHRDAEAYREQAARGRAVAAERFAPEVHVARLQRLIGRPARHATRRARTPVRTPARAPLRARAAPAARTSRTSTGCAKRPVLFTATNGIGLGHLTQLLAIAKRVPADVQPIFATMSQATAIVRAAGFPAHFFPDYRYAESPYGLWNRWLEIELSALVEFYDARAVVFDGVIPYDGIVRAGARRANLPMMWVRIPMWKRAIWDDSVDRAKYFDLVLDTGELAEARNVGARIPYPERLEVIPPMLLCDEDELLPREEARARLGLDADGPAVLLQLGSGNNQALVPVVQHIVSTLEDLGIAQVVIADWVIAEHPLETWPSVTMLRGFPNAHYLRAFDFVVSAAGYNTFHELIGYGLPTIFVPNEKVETDDQLGRSRFAEEQGLGLCMAVGELDNFESYAQRLLDPAERARLSAACRKLSWRNGAEVAAERLAALM